MKKLFLLLTLLSCLAIGCQEKKPTTPASTPQHDWYRGHRYHPQHSG